MDRLNKSTSANCADKRKKQRSRLRLWWGFSLLVAHTMAWAQDYPEYPANVSTLPIWEKQSSGNFRIEGVIDISSPINVTGELKLYPVATSNNPTPTIRRIFNGVTDNLPYAVFVLDGTDKLSIVGNENNRLTFFGGTGNINNPIPTNERNMGGAVQCEGNAEVRLKYVNLARFAVKTEGGLGDAVIALNGASSNGKCYLDHTTFSNCYAGQWDLTATDNTSWGRIFSLRAGTWEVIMDDVDIHDCIVHERRNSNHSGIYGMGGIIRSQGNVGGSLLMRNCTIKDNQYRDLYKDGATTVSYYSTRYSEVAQQPLSGQGGAINWRSGAFAINQETQVTISGCDFHDNFAMLGGAIATCATIEMNNTSIYGNKAEEGGGVYFWTYNANQDAYDGRGFTAEFNRNTLIYENTATVCGGGIAIRIDASDDVGFSADGTSRNVEFKVNLMAAEGLSQIRKNHAPKGAGVAIIDRAPKNHKNTREELMDNSSNNPAYNRWSGEYTRTISIEGSEIFDNTTSSDLFSLGQNDKVAGGGIYIDKTSEDAPFPADYTVSNDGAGNSGGGGGSLTVNVKHGTIYGNNAINDTREGLGGGLYIANPMKNDFPSSELTVNIGNDTPQLHINKNQAYTHGGGFYILGGNVNITRGSNQTLQIGLNPNDNNNVYRGGNKALNGNGGGFCVLGGVVTVNGGNIEYNTAANGLGGGVYVSVPNNNSKTTIQGGANINENTAKGGGGVYVDKGELDVFGNRWNNATGEWEMLDWTGYTNPGSETTHTRITNNSATDGNGGGINAGNGEVDIFNTLIYYNTADGTVSKGRGGGVYLDGGIIKIVSSKILYNTAETNGGGIDDHSGDIEIYGGDISHNTATNGRGGGIYTNAGDIRIWPSALYNNPASAPSLNDCKNTGTAFSYNTAGTNGGGLNTHIGRLDVRYAKVHHNVAGYNYTTIGTQGGSGGGMFCEGPHADLSGYTVRLLHTLLNYNKAYGNGGSDDNLTGRGGGLYLKYGSIFAEHCNILGNKADINGGGLDNHDGELRVYGSIIGKSLEETMPEDCKAEDDDENGNRAISGRGGGLYTDKGNLVVGPCDSYGFVESKASRICNNTAYINGGGINNHEGNITIHGDRINNNTATTGKGGGVYINSGNIYMYGGQINNNSANDPSGGYGGGVYGGGGTFNIMEREAHPILEILDVENITTDGFTVHFHHVDRGNAMKEDAEDKEYGIAFSVNPYPSDLGENVEWTVGTGTNTDWTGVTKVSFNPTSTQPTPPAHHSYNQNEGCSRFVVNNSTTPNGITINSNTTYYVVAYGKYTYGGKNYFDASPAVKVKTHGDNPVVVTGVAFDVTANSASVNAKLFYNGIGEVTVTSKGFQLSTDGGNTWGPQRESLSVGDVFSYTFEGLSANTSYMARAYATNSDGHTGYSEGIIQFTTLGNGGGKAAEGNYPKSIYPSVEENPFFMELTPLQQAILASTPEADTTKQHHSPAAKDDPTPNVDGPVDIPQINNNTATYGGGVCIDKQGAELIFAGSRNSNATEMGQINNNYASEAGGGIYIGKESAERYAKMQMMGKCEVNFNHVPAGKQGGGIYLDGRLYVGDKDTDAIGTHGLKVDQNYAVNGNGAGLPANYAANGKLNNVFLTRYDYDYNINATSAGDNNVSVITLLSDISGFAGEGNTNPYSHIGFSVLKGFCPVIATSDCFTKVEQGQTVDGNYDLHNYTPTGGTSQSSEIWLQNLMRMAGVDSGSGTANTLKGAVFEDSESYVAVHTHTDIPPFRSKFIFLWGCWTHPIVKVDPETNNPMAGEGSGGAWLGHYKIKNPTDNKEITNENPNTTPLEWEIYSPEGLAWFSAYVNGLNAFDEVTGATDNDNNHHAWNKDKNPYAIAHIMNDLDMSAYLWVPIGSVKYFYNNLINENGGSLFVDSEETLQIGEHEYSDEHKFKGVFDGQGHIITGLQGLYLTGIKKYGLFGYLDGNAVVKNTFVDDGLFVSDDKTVVYSAGGIAGEMKGGSVVSNSEARMGFNASYSGAGTALGGLVGDVKGGSIHSSMAMPFFTGHDKGQAGENPTYNAFEGYMGGLAGRLGSGCDLKNSFANSEIVLTTEGTGSTAPRHIGGLVGENNGTVENCYVRYRGATRPSDFGWAAGINHGTITVCFAPEGKVGEDDGQSWYTGGDPVTLRRTYGETSLVSGKYGFAHKDQQVFAYGDDSDDYIKNGAMDADGLNGLLASLNNWVKAKNTTTDTYSTWTRTMGSPINDDYPIIQIADFNSVGSKDGVFMVYEDDINDMWAESGKDFQACNTAGSNAAMYLYDAQPETVTITNNDNVRLYIHEDVGIKQSQNSVLHARVGVTIKNKATGDVPNWHLFSSSINEVPMGIRYRTAEDNTNMNIEGYGTGTYKALIVDKANASGHDDPYHPESVWSNRAYFDPPMIEWYQSDDASQAATYFPNKVGYFPTNTPYGTWRSTYSSDFFDLYAYSEEFYHWVNFKREGSSTISDHWHMDRDEESNHWRLNYGFRDESGNFTLGNEPTLLDGKGYLLDLSSESMMMADGTLNTGTVATWTTNTPVGTNSPTGNGYDAPWREINLIGNPYQSFLDFNEFAKANMPAGSGENAWKNAFYATRDDNSQTSRNGYVYYVPTQSENKSEYTANQYIHPHQGFFVKVTSNGTLTFNDNMRVAGTSTTLKSPYRDRLNYPLVNLLCYDDNGDCDLTIVEVNRPEFGGGQKMKKLHSSNGMIYARLEDKDFHVLFTPAGTNTVPVRFEAAENGHFTLRWNTLHADFSYLHLIDNIAGVDIDCLTTDEYKFEGKTTDYKSRFKLVFDCMGINEPEAPELDEVPTVFAFQMGDELIVNGEGMLQLLDLNGRCLMTKQAVGQQSSVSLPQVAAGMYLLRLTDNRQVRVQKMIIK